MQSQVRIDLDEESKVQVNIFIVDKIPYFFSVTDREEKLPFAMVVMGLPGMIESRLFYVHTDKSSRYGHGSY